MPKKIHNEENKNDYLVTLLEVFKEETDKEHRAKLNKLAELTAKKAGKSKSFDTRTIKNYIDILKKLGFDIQGPESGYYLVKRYLDRSEAKLLCDQITFSSIMPAVRKTQIINGLLSDLTNNDKELLKSEIEVDYKATASLIYQDTLSNVKEILNAIENDKMIKFKYGDYDENKKLITNGKEYHVSPYEFVFEQGKYYIMCQDEKDVDTIKTKNFRIDLMTEVRSMNKVREQLPIEENLTDYCIKQLNMYSLEDEKEIELEVDKLGLRGLYDKLGIDAKKLKVRKKTDGLYVANFEASLAGTQFLVEQYIEHMKVNKPKKLKENIKKILLKSLEKYSD